MEYPSHLSLVERRAGNSSLADFFSQEKRLFDPESALTLVKLFVGDCYVTTRADEVLMTVLGSCIAVCARDPDAGVGGMNHFILPGEENSSCDAKDASRYGVCAIRQLIEAIVHAGGRREHLEIKVFGGGNVTQSSNAIGSKNVQFLRSFLAREGLPIVAEDLGGSLPRRVHYYPLLGKVMLRKLRRKDDLLIAEQQTRTQMRMMQSTDDNQSLR